jgi:hypothetical protein
MRQVREPFKFTRHNLTTSLVFSSFIAAISPVFSFRYQVVVLFIAAILFLTSVAIYSKEGTPTD